MRLKLNPKTIKSFRTSVVADTVYKEGWKKVVVLSCGNAFESLKACLPGVEVIGLATSSPYPGAFQLEDRLYQKNEIKKLFPDAFDASPGALNDKVMKKIGGLFNDFLWKNNIGYSKTLLVPVGSGETLISLSYFRNNLVGYYCPTVPAINFDYSYLADRVRLDYPLIKIGDLSELDKLEKHFMVIDSSGED